MRTNQWILKKPLWDILFISFPGFFGVIYASFFAEKSVYFIAYAFLVLVILDGHIYITGFRTVFNKEERSRHVMYWMVPLFTLLTVIVWVELRIPYLWTAVVYMTVYHHIRQFYGYLRWYEKYNGRFDVISHWFLHILTILPFIIFHFRGIQSFKLFSENELFSIDAPQLYQAGLPVYFFFLLSWIVYELWLQIKQKKELNRFSAMLGPISLCGWCFLWAPTAAHVALPLLMQHAISYFAVMGLSLRKIYPVKYPSWKKVLFVLIGVSSVLVLFERFVIENDVRTFYLNYTVVQMSLMEAVITGIFIVPLICHYIWDAYIWTGKHRDAVKIYAD